MWDSAIDHVFNTFTKHASLPSLDLLTPPKGIFLTTISLIRISAEAKIFRSRSRSKFCETGGNYLSKSHGLKAPLFFFTTGKLLLWNSLTSWWDIYSKWLADQPRRQENSSVFGGDLLRGGRKPARLWTQVRRAAAGVWDEYAMGPGSARTRSAMWFTLEQSRKRMLQKDWIQKSLTVREGRCLSCVAH